MKKRGKLIRLLILLLIIGAAGWYFFIRKHEVKTDHGILTLYGDVDVRLVNLGFQVSGRVIRMPFEEGTLVKTGQKIAQVDPLPFQQTVHQNVAQLGVQAANLDKLLVGTRDEVIQQDRAVVADREAALKNAEAIYLKDQAAVKLGAISEQDYENAVNQRNSAQAQLQNAQQILREAINGPQIQDIQAARASVKAAKAAMAYAQTQLKYVDLFAPTNGTIQTRVREPGAVVNVGDAVYTMAISSPKWAQVYLEEPDLGRVKPGQKANIYMDTEPKHPLSGQVGFISPVAEFTPKNVETRSLRTELVYPARVVVIDPDNKLRQGMPVTVKINTGVSRPLQKQDLL